MTSFNNVLRVVVDACFKHQALRESSLCIIRDLQGRVRIALKVENTPVENSLVNELETELQASLGGYFVAPILEKRKGREFGQLAQALIKKGEAWPDNWPRPKKDLLGDEEEPPASWKTLERVLGKEAWLRATTNFSPIWPYLAGKTPVVVTFHSFKGGVGRTTLAAAFAMKLVARDARKRVAIVDLDLEAPGLAALFRVDKLPDSRGVLDVLVDHIATSNLNLESVKIPVPFLKGEVHVFPAGTLDHEYLAKLGRLDFASSEPNGENPVEHALRAFLQRLKNDYDVIILDSRAGLHDLAGIALPLLAHIDVLIFRGTSQGLQGLDLTLSRLGRKRSIVMAETMLPANDDEYFASRLERSRERIYEMMCSYNYESDELPQLMDHGVPHNVIGIRRKEYLDNLDAIHDRINEVLADRDIEEFAVRVTEAIRLVDESEDKRANAD